MAKLPQDERPDTCCSYCGSRDHSYEACDRLDASRDDDRPMSRYRVEEYSATMPSGRSWELNALDAIQAVSHATGRTAHLGVKRGALAFKVMLASDNAQQVEWYHLSE